jgi:hypothetical protein
VKGRISHRHRLQPSEGPGEVIEKKALAEAHSGKTAEGESLGAPRLKRRAGGRVSGKKATRRVDKRARGGILREAEEKAEEH